MSYKLNKSILDNRKMFSQSSFEYEKNIHSIQATQENNMRDQQNYSYGNPLQDDIYQYRYDSFLSGSRDVDTLPKQYVDYNINSKEKEKEKTRFERADDRSNENVLDSGVCGIDEDGVTNICGKGKKLYSIMDPRFNLREAAKNMILLEDHLFHSGKQCHDCILKHCLTIEGFLEEGITLDKKREYTDIFKESEEKFRSIFKNLSGKILADKDELTDQDCHQFAQEIRKIRKPLCQKFATFF